MLLSVVHLVQRLFFIARLRIHCFYKSCFHTMQSFPFPLYYVGFTINRHNLTIVQFVRKKKGQVFLKTTQFNMVNLEDVISFLDHVLERYIQHDDVRVTRSMGNLRLHD